MKKILIIMLIAGLMMIACANPTGDNMDNKNPFVGTWKNLMATNGVDIVYIFRDDGTFDHWNSAYFASGSGKYTYTDTHINFYDFSFTRANGTTGVYQDSSQIYVWIDEYKFGLQREDSQSFTGGQYTRQ